MKSNQVLQTPIYTLKFPTRIFNVLRRYNIETIEQLVSLSPQDIMKRRNSSSTQAKIVAEKMETWFDNHGLSKEGYPLFSKDYSNKINGVTIKKADYINVPYPLTQTNRERLYSQLDDIAAERVILTNQIKKTIQIDAETNNSIARTRSRLNLQELLIHDELISSAKIIDENCLTTYRISQKIKYSDLAKQVGVNISSIKSYEHLANVWVNRSKNVPLHHYYLSQIYANTRLNGYFRALGFSETEFIMFIGQTILPIVDGTAITVATENDKLALFIEVLDLDHSAYDILIMRKVRTISDLLSRTPIDIKSIRNVTDTVYDHIVTQAYNWCINQNITLSNHELFKTTANTTQI